MVQQKPLASDATIPKMCRHFIGLKMILFNNSRSQNVKQEIAHFLILNTNIFLYSNIPNQKVNISTKISALLLHSGIPMLILLHVKLIYLYQFP